MEKQQFLQMIKKPKELNSRDITSLEKVLNVFPYFQTAHILTAKASMNSENMLAPSYLKKAAVYAGNRAHLKKFINNVAFTTASFPEYFEETEEEIENQSIELEEIKENNVEIEQPKVELIEEFEVKEIEIQENSIEVEVVENQFEVDFTNSSQDIIEESFTEKIVEEINTETTLEEIHNEILINNLETIVNTVIAEEENSISDEVNETLIQLHKVREKALTILNLVESNSETTEVETSNTIDLNNQFIENEPIQTVKEEILEEEIASLTTEIEESEPKLDIENIEEKNEEVVEEIISVEVPIIKEEKQNLPILDTTEIATSIDISSFVEDNLIENVAIEEFKKVEKSIYEFKNISLTHTLFEEIATSREGFMNYFGTEPASISDYTLDYLQNLRKEKRKKKTPSKVQQKEIIDNFIVSKPKLSKITKSEISDSQSNNKDLSEKSVTFSDKLISETFAKILQKQGKKTQAIEMYQKLILKYPQKKTYFVELIKNLEEK